MTGADTDRLPDRSALAELAPLLRRVVDLDARVVVRVRLAGGTTTGSGAGLGDGPGTATAYLRVPFGVLVSRTVPWPPTGGAELDAAYRATDLLAWLDAVDADGFAGADAVKWRDAATPSRRDAEWRAPLPPRTGWRRLDTVPDDVVRPLVRQGALALKDAAEREGVPGAQPRAEVADSLLDAVVLTVRADDPAGQAAAEIDLRTLSALTRMGFLPRGGQAHVDVCGSWTRVTAAYGTVYSPRSGGLTVVRRTG